jgi:hypothetical protein
LTLTSTIIGKLLFLLNKENKLVFKARTVVKDHVEKDWFDECFGNVSKLNKNNIDN